jgi:hypothetical protein
MESKKARYIFFKKDGNKGKKYQSFLEREVGTSGSLKFQYIRLRKQNIGPIYQT